jgi:xanthine dehydrogenase accessory factor
VIRPELAASAKVLVDGRRPFVVATVVRAARPASARPGDQAIVHPDGRIEGFVGGACATSTVRLHALRTLETEEPLLLAIRPGAEGEPDVRPGAVTVANPCLSGGELEIFLEPQLPAPVIRVLGDSPIAESLARLSAPLGFAVVAGGTAEPGDTAVVVASHGNAEESALEAALRAGVPYVGLVASPRRGAAVVAALGERGLDPAVLAGLKTPAGLDIGSRTHAEVALSILAEIVQRRAAGSRPIAALAPAAAGAVDPVCGMTEPPAGGFLPLLHEGRELRFCCEGCRRRFEEDPARYAAALERL